MGQLSAVHRCQHPQQAGEEVRAVSPQQLALELSELRRTWNAVFAEKAISDASLMVLLKENSPSALMTAIRKTQSKFQASPRNWTFGGIRRAFLNELSSTTSTKQPDGEKTTAGTDSSVPARQYTKKEAAALLGVGERTICRWMAIGKLKFNKAEHANRWKQTVSFTREQLGLPPEPVPVPLEVSHPAPPVESERFNDFATGWQGPDQLVFVSSDGYVYRRNAQGQMYRSGERKLAGSLLPNSPSAADSCIRHPWSVEPSNKPAHEINEGKGICDIDPRGR
jgi:hypothetical protein